MAKAHLTLPDGTTVNIEGTVEEVANLLSHFSAPQSPLKRANKPPKKRSSSRPVAKDQKPKRKGPQTLIEELVRENYFKSKRTIGEVQKKLEEGGHIYAIYSLSTPLLRLTRCKTLRRIKDKDGWAYVS